MLVAIVAFEGCKDTKKAQENKGGDGGDGQVAVVPDVGNGLKPDDGGAGGNGGNGGKGGKPKSRKTVPNPPVPVAPVVKIVNVGLPPDGVNKKEVTVRGSIFAGAGKDGDFKWMMSQDQYKKTFFVFNDNEEQFDAYQAMVSPVKAIDKANTGCQAGSGNAAIRPQQCEDPANAAGVPTGKDRKGYEKLDDAVKDKVKKAIAWIRESVAAGDFDTVVFSQARNAATLGSGTYQVAKEVRDYIFNSLLELEAK